MWFTKKALPLFIIIPALFVIISCEGQVQEGSANLLQIDETAPMIKHNMKDISGVKVNLASLKRDNGLVVVFSCNTCPFVIAWEDRYNVVADLCNQSTIGMVAINSNEAKRDGDDSMEAMISHAKEKGYNFKYTVDTNSELAKAFGATKTPQVFLFDKDLKLVYTGAIDDNLKNAEKVEHFYLQDAINNMMSGNKIDPNVTKALGCSIKKVKHN